MLVSFSVTPQVDTVDVLRAYADSQNGVDDSKWNLFTGFSIKKIFMSWPENLF